MANKFALQTCLCQEYFQVFLQSKIGGRRRLWAVGKAAIRIVSPSLRRLVGGNRSDPDNLQI
jgi:hypothetical protein